MIGKTNRKHDRIIHYEAGIQRMRFDTLSRVYGYLNDVTMHAECYGGYISMDQMFKHYEDLKLPAIAYDYDNSEKWGLSLERLQHVGVYKTPKEIRFTQMSVNAVYGKGDGYYLVVRGVETMEALKNDQHCLYRKFF
jgi:hypothetical protein